MGQHKRPGDPNKRPLQPKYKRELKYISSGRPMNPIKHRVQTAQHRGKR